MLKKIVAALCACLLLTGCQRAPAGDSGQKNWSSQVFAMDTVMDLSIYADDDRLLTEAETLIGQLEDSFSTTDPHSEIYQLNQAGNAVLGPDSADLLGKALSYCAETGGALDLSVYPVVRAWGFTTDTYQVPSAEELDALLPAVDYSKIDFDAATGAVSLPQGMEIDLGSVAKGYTADRLCALFRDGGVTSALLNLGGNVQAVGSKPDGSDWRVGVRDPLEKDGYLGILSMHDQAVVTSGGYERYFEKDGQVYWHIIDPSTGYPAKNGLISATVVGPEGVRCDALSTSLFIMGPEKAADFWHDHQDFGMVLVTDDNRVLISPDLADSFALMDNSPYELTVI